MIRKLLFLFFALSASCLAQQNVQILVPQQLVTTSVVVNGLPAGCTFTATGGTQVTVTVSNCPTVTPPPPPPPPPTPGVLAIGATVTIAPACANPCHVWPNMSATNGASGTPINISPGMTGTITAGPIVNSSGTWWQVKLANGTTGWTIAANYICTSPAPASVKLSWTPSDSANVTGYNVYRGTVSTTLSKIALSTAATYTDSTVFHGPTHFYAVTALGDPKLWTKPESVYSNIVQVNP